jgi:hypothetical protein
VDDDGPTRRFTGLDTDVSLAFASKLGVVVVSLGVTSIGNADAPVDAMVVAVPVAGSVMMEDSDPGADVISAGIDCSEGVDARGAMLAVSMLSAVAAGMSVAR